MTITTVINKTSRSGLTPYISPDMFIYGSYGVSISTLVAGAPGQDQVAALAGYIERATSMMDDYMDTSLAASVNVDEGPLNYRDGFWVAQPRFRPAVALLSFSVGGAVNDLSTYTSLDGANVTDSKIMVPVGPLGNWNTPQGPIQLGAPSGVPWRAYGRWTYVSGFPVTWLTQGEAAGATTISVAETLGIFANMTQLVVQAGKNRTRFVATSVSTADSSGFGQGAGVIGCPPLPFAIDNNASYPVYVTGAPGSVVEACALGTRALIKRRSAGNLSAPTGAGESRRNPDPLGAGDDLAMMYRLIDSYRVLST